MGNWSWIGVVIVNRKWQSAQYWFYFNSTEWLYKWYYISLLHESVSKYVGVRRISLPWHQVLLKNSPVTNWNASYIIRMCECWEFSYQNLNLQPQHFFHSLQRTRCYRSLCWIHLAFGDVFMENAFSHNYNQQTDMQENKTSNSPSTL